MVYMSKKKATELIRKCLDEMYRNSTPPIAWQECEVKYTDIPNWYQMHLVDIDVYDEIYDRYLALLPKMYYSDFFFAMLGYSPSVKRKITPTNIKKLRKRVKSRGK